MDLLQELSCNGIAPSGPVSAWPKDRHDTLISKSQAQLEKTKVNASLSRMASGLVKTGIQAIANGRVSEEIRNERYEICKKCPLFIEDSKRCSECGCFMEAKTWVGGDPDMLCPRKKWSR